MPTKFRTMWMFPRNIRKITPLKMSSIAMLLQASNGDASSQSIQDGLYKQLEGLGIKVAKKENGVPNPGGMRTYFAQLACLGLFWHDKKNKTWKTTLAGEALIATDNPLKVLRCQLLRMQYPSVYGNGTQVSISPSLRVKPFCFLIRLLQDSRLQYYLTSNEMAVAVVYGRTDSDYEKVVEKILCLRTYSNFATIIDSPSDLSTPRRANCNDIDFFHKGIEDAQTIGNTAKNYLEAVQLIFPLSDEPKKYELTKEREVLDEIDSLSKEALLPPPEKGFEPRWQLRYGRYNKTKDTRNQNSVPHIDGKKALLQSRYLIAIQNNPFSIDNSTFCSSESTRWGLPIADISAAIEPLRAKKHSLERAAVIEASLSGGAQALILEKAITHIFVRLGFDLSEHIGQKRAPREGGYPDIRIRATGLNTCGFGDTKATVCYKFPLGDTEKLASYYHDCWKEFDDHTPADWFLYVAGGFGGNQSQIENKLQTCSKKYGHSVSAITVNALLDLVEMENPPSCQELAQIFKVGGYYTCEVIRETTRRISDSE